MQPKDQKHVNNSQEIEEKVHPHSTTTGKKQNSVHNRRKIEALAGSLQLQLISNKNDGSTEGEADTDKSCGTKGSRK